jgi:hypothetical protein
VKTAGFAMIGVFAALAASCSDRAPDLERRGAALQRGLDAAVKSESGRFRRCARMIGDHYRSIDRADIRVELEMQIDIDASAGRATVRGLHLELPDELPADVEHNARVCYEELFPRAFSTEAEYRGALTYPLCVSVMPEPPNG